MNKVNRWSYRQNFAYLNTDFGMELACKKFGLSREEIVAKVGIYSKGKRKGQVKGKLIWLKVEQGGWVRTGSYDWEAMQARGFIAKPGTCFAFQIVDAWSDMPILNHPDTIVDPHLNYVEASESYLQTIDSKWRSKMAQNEPNQG